MLIVETVSTVGANGAVQYARRIIPELQRRGHEVILAALPDSWIASELAGQVEIRETRFERWPPRHLREFAGLCRSRGVDVVHSHLTRANNFAALLHALYGIRNLAHSHDNRPQVHYLFHDRVVAVSRDTLRRHRRYGAGLGRRGEVLHNFVDAGVFAPRPQGAADPLRSLIGVGPDTPVILQVGEISRRKGQAITLHAMPEVWRRHPAARMVFIGAGLALECPDPRVHWLGLRADVPRLLPWASLALQPSLDEPFGFAALEALACAVPVVATAVGGALEVVTPGTGVLVPPRSPQLLAAAINQLLENPQVRVQMGSAGRLRALERFAFSPHIDQLEKLLREVAALRR